MQIHVFMRGITAALDSFFSPHDEGVSAVQANGNKERRLRLSGKTLYHVNVSKHAPNSTEQNTQESNSWSFKEHERALTYSKERPLGPIQSNIILVRTLPHANASKFLPFKFF
jgi:hypothetical protein